MNQGNSSDASPNMPVKRKRGRPRKDQSLNHRKSVPVPPGFEGVNGNPDANASIVGQAVTGVVNAEFDAGYLLSVRIGNSNSILKGVVFKPGNYVPISSENDVAPYIRMIRRIESPLPAGNQRKHVSPLATGAVPPVGSRGTVVPVVLQPVNLSNGVVPPVSSQAAGHHVAPLGMKNENRPLPQRAEVESMKYEVNERVRGSSQPSEGDNVNEPLFVQPLQAIRSDIHNYYETFPKP